LKLSAEHHDKIRGLLAKGQSYAAIARALKAEDGVSVSREMVGKFARSNRSLRADAAKETVRGKVAASLEADLALFDEERERFRSVLAKQAELAEQKPDARRLYTIMFEEYRHTVEAKVKWSGAEEPDTDFVAGIADLLGLVLDDEGDAPPTSDDDDDDEPDPAADEVEPA
jgi:hypothetical protein